MKISVVIPNFNGASTLPQVLESLKNQSKKPDEIIVIDDGSTDTSLEVLKKFPEVILLCEENSGAPVARNKGIKKASGDIILFIDNDIIPSSDFVYEHLTTHEKNIGEKVAVVGLTRWDPNMKLTPFMMWLEEGMQFDYKKILGKTNVTFESFYTSNLSIKKSFIQANPFDEDFRIAGGTAYEDTELGFRLEKLGMTLLFNKQALAYHHEIKTLQQIKERKFQQGKISHLLYLKHPEIKTYFKEGIKKFATPLILSPVGWAVELFAKIIENKIKIGAVFYIAVMRSYVKGQHAVN